MISIPITATLSPPDSHLLTPGTVNDVVITKLGGNRMRLDGDVHDIHALLASKGCGLTFKFTAICTFPWASQVQIILDNLEELWSDVLSMDTELELYNKWCDLIISKFVVS